MRFLKTFLILLTLLYLSEESSAQRRFLKDSSLIQFSGVFLDADSLIPVPWVNVVVVNRDKGTTTDFKGAFSFVAYPGDTVRFTCVGYKPFQCIIPDTLSTQRYTLIQLFSRDTITLPEAIIYPWPSKEEFREAFLNLYIPDDDLERAKKNLEREEKKAKLYGEPNSGYINYQWSNQLYTEKLYYAGQPPPIQIFNPFAWAAFFKALEDGALKDPRKQKD